MRYFGVLAVAFVGVCVAVPLGVFTAVDRSAFDLMPWLTPISHPETAASILLPFGRHTAGLELPAKLWIYPASVPMSALVLGGCCTMLWRGGRRRVALAWAAAWTLGNIVEVAGKTLIHRPALFMNWQGRRAHVVGFDNSFPSGHALRALLIAALIGLLWRHARVCAAVWATVTLLLLVITNAHTPSDVIGGAALAGALIASIYATLAVPLFS